MKLQYFLIRLFLFPFAYLPQTAIVATGNVLGFFAYHLIPKFRKRALSNLALSDLHLTKNQRKKVALASTQNLVINCLEYPKFARADVAKLIVCENPTYAQRLIDSGQGIVFFCGHQANWETLFLDGTRRMPGVAIGRPIKNNYLYAWVKSIRERFGGTIVEPKKALGKGLRALKEGKFMGIVGDQGMVDGYASTFLGRRAFTSPAPAMLAYKTSSPLMVATTKRIHGKYFIHYSDPIWPDLTKTMDEEVPRMMDEALRLYEESIRARPHEWMWQHNRWKQEAPDIVYYEFRHDTILIILNESQLSVAPLLRTIYPKAFLTFCIPDGTRLTLDDVEIFYYTDPSECLLDDYRFKLVLNIAELAKVANHYSRRAAQVVANLSQLEKKAEEHLSPGYTLSDVIERALARPGTVWKSHAS